MLYITKYLRINHIAYGLLDLQETRGTDCQFVVIVEIGSKLFYQLNGRTEIMKIYDLPRFGHPRVYELRNVTTIDTAEIIEIRECIDDPMKIAAASEHKITSCMKFKLRCTGYNIKFIKKPYKIFKKLWLR